MNIKFTFGYPDLLLVCGVISVFRDQMAFGITLCILSVMAAVTSMGMAVQKRQEEEVRRQALLNEMQNAGEEFAETLVELFGKDKSKKIVH